MHSIDITRECHVYMFCSLKIAHNGINVSNLVINHWACHTLSAYEHLTGKPLSVATEKGRTKELWKARLTGVRKEELDNKVDKH